LVTAVTRRDDVLVGAVGARDQANVVEVPVAHCPDPRPNDGEPKAHTQVGIPVGRDVVDPLVPCIVIHTITGLHPDYDPAHPVKNFNPSLHIRYIVAVEPPPVPQVDLVGSCRVDDRALKVVIIMHQLITVATNDYASNPVVGAGGVIESRVRVA